MGDRCVAATSLRCCGGTPGDQDGRGTNELSKIESILGTRMSQNLSRDRRLAWPGRSRARRRTSGVCSRTVRRKSVHFPALSPKLATTHWKEPCWRRSRAASGFAQENTSKDGCSASTSSALPCEFSFSSSTNRMAGIPRLPVTYKDQYAGEFPRLLVLYRPGMETLKPDFLSTAVLRPCKVQLPVASISEERYPNRNVLLWDLPGCVWRRRMFEPLLPCWSRVTREESHVLVTMGLGW